MKDHLSHERLEARLREELGRLARVPVPGLSERVLARLPARRAHPRRTAFALAAAAAALLVWLATTWMDSRDGDATEDRVVVQAPSVAPARAWVALGAPLAPEAPLRDEARRLASDTRRAAASLWDRLPLTSFLTRGSR
jgi:hypothetical protein